MEETDSEFVGDEEEMASSLVMPATPDFKRQLLALQRLTERARTEAQVADRQLPPSPPPETEYVTMKPLTSYLRYGNKADSSRSQRRPLLETAAAADTDSEPEDNKQAYGFPSQHTYDLPLPTSPHSPLPPPQLSSFNKYQVSL